MTASDMQAPILGSQVEGSKAQDSSISVQNHIGEITRPTFHVSIQDSPTIFPSNSNGVKGKGMQLGGKSHVTASNANLADQLAEEVAASDILAENPWGTNDLIDVNADEDDWSTLSPFSFPDVKVILL